MYNYFLYLEIYKFNFVFKIITKFIMAYLTEKTEGKNKLMQDLECHNVP